MIIFGFTLRQQVRRFCRKLGWPIGAAECAADIAVDVSGSNLPLFSEDLRQVLGEACRSDGDGYIGQPVSGSAE